MAAPQVLGKEPCVEIFTLTNKIPRGMVNLAAPSRQVPAKLAEKLNH